MSFFLLILLLPFDSDLATTENLGLPRGLALDYYSKFVRRLSNESS